MADEASGTRCLFVSSLPARGGSFDPRPGLTSRLRAPSPGPGKSSTHQTYPARAELPRTGQIRYAGQAVGSAARLDGEPPRRQALAWHSRGPLPHP